MTMKKKAGLSDGVRNKESKWDQRSYNTIMQAVVMIQIMGRTSLHPGGSVDDLLCEIDAIDDFDIDWEHRIWRKSLRLLDKWQIVELYRSNYTEGIFMHDGWRETMQEKFRSLPTAPIDREPFPSTTSIDPESVLGFWLINQFPQRKIKQKSQYRAVDHREDPSLTQDAVRNGQEPPHDPNEVSEVSR
jgi:hypothetical protein